MNHKALMRGNDGSSEETFVSVRQARGKGKGEGAKEEGAREKEILDRGSREIIRIEGAQDDREEILGNGEAQNRLLTQEVFDGEGR